MLELKVYNYRKNIGVNLSDLGLDSGFLDITTKAQ